MRTTTTEASTSPAAWSYKDAFANLLSANLKRRTPKPIVLDTSLDTSLDSSLNFSLDPSLPRQGGTLQLGSAVLVKQESDSDAKGSEDSEDHDHGDHGSDHPHGEGHNHGEGHEDHGHHSEHGDHHDHDHGDHEDHGHGHPHHSADHFATLAASKTDLPRAPPGNLVS